MPDYSRRWRAPRTTTATTTTTLRPEWEWPRQHSSSSGFGFGGPSDYDDYDVREETFAARMIPERPLPPVSRERHHATLTNRSPLPTLEDIPRDHERCLALKNVLWRRDGRCYPLLHRGPCPDGQWLVLAADGRGQVWTTCEERTCPCSPDDPLMCEVRYEANRRNGGHHGQLCESGCRVALAAEQDGLCGRGEQLLVSPYGRGICGCRRTARGGKRSPHIRWPEDQTCYPLHERGPCPANQTLQYDAKNARIVCVATLCPQGMILYRDGRCYRLHRQGPCQPGFSLMLAEQEGFDDEDISSSDPICKPDNDSRVKRVFDLAPGGEMREELHRNRLVGSLRARACPGGSAGCGHGGAGGGQRKREDRGRERLAKARSYLTFLRSFQF